jgi:branched-chain amino acid transport system substrate-binding protein
VNIGVISALTGIVGPIGQSQLMGAKVAALHINEEGGIMGHKIVIVEKDTGARPTMAVKVAREAVMNEDVKLFVGGVSSGVALAIAPIVEQLDSIFIACAAASDKITGINCNPHVFRICTRTEAASAATAKLLAVDRYGDVKRWAGINPDYEYGHMAWGTFKAALKKLDPKVTIVEEVYPKFMAKSYEPEILKILEAKPDGIYSSLYSGDFITFVKQAKKYGFFEKIKVFLNPSAATDVAEALGSEIVEYWGGGHYYHEAYDSALNTKFYKTHQKLFDKMPYYASSETYSALYALKYAIEKAKSFKTKAVIKALRGLTFDSVNGKRLIRAKDHQAVKNDLLLHFVPIKESPGWKVDEHLVYWNEPFNPIQDSCKMSW